MLLQLQVPQGPRIEEARVMENRVDAEARQKLLGGRRAAGPPGISPGSRTSTLKPACARFPAATSSSSPEPITIAS